MHRMQHWNDSSELYEVEFSHNFVNDPVPHSKPHP